MQRCGQMLWQIDVQHRCLLTLVYLTTITTLMQQSSAQAVSGTAFDIQQWSSFESAFWAHRHWQQTALQQAHEECGPPSAVVLQLNDFGFGNRIPPLVAGYLMAMMTGRVLLLQQEHDIRLTDYLQVNVPCEWEQYKAAYSNSSRCSISHSQHVADGGLRFCGVGSSSSALAPDVDIIEYPSYDYDVPLLQVNPTLAVHFDRLFPDGEVFYHVSKLLIQPREHVRTAMLPYMERSNDCVVGMHLRHKKKVFKKEPQYPQFAGVTRSLARRAKNGNIFVSADKDVFSEVAALLGEFEVWWSNISKSDIESNTGPGGNPGTELSAIVDMLLLSRCKHIIMTPGSSFGGTAAALGGIQPVYATYGHHSAPFLNPWFWQSITSEPCMYKGGAKEQKALGTAARLLKAKHPLYFYHNQCHP